MKKPNIYVFIMTIMQIIETGLTRQHKIADPAEKNRRACHDCRHMECLQLPGSAPKALIARAKCIARECFSHVESHNGLLM